eukprot:CAMPEP_0113470832 /NCGR_PEP_ID=MMETSP0014_2-20120614/16658_1 /TAXON_ID=2857 /ORGANISM="Nitzschia sp." /LENGTH=259 /DNA_ID=CAMNT_0000363433 /DNA_START=176 /DNA_END=952 /DNA_ORIENTATION=+ /assembly_acc=CAM_ASM_000159
MKRSSISSGSGRSSRWDKADSSTKKKKNESSSSSSHYGPAHVEEEHDSEEKRKRPKHRHGGSGRDSEDGDVDNRYGPSKTNDDDEKEEEDEKEPEYKPNFGLSGALAKDMQTGNVYKGVQLKFKEPPEARCPANTQWRFYVFKKGQEGVLETLHISKQSAYLMGRNADIADIPLLHPSLSSQHAVLQYRAMHVNKGNGGERVLSCQPYIMDLESTNGTYLNGIQIDAARYYQLKKGDVLTFGASTREYVLMTENTTSTS